jgi:hypothetical protein
MSSNLVFSKTPLPNLSLLLLLNFGPCFAVTILLLVNGTGFQNPRGSQVRVPRGTGPGMDCPTRITRRYPCLY